MHKKTIMEPWYSYKKHQSYINLIVIIFFDFADASRAKTYISELAHVLANKRMYKRINECIISISE